MWICPNCHHQEKFPTICSHCHFDGSSDVLRYPTLVPLTGRSYSRMPPQNTGSVTAPDPGPIQDAPASPGVPESPAGSDTRPASSESISDAEDPRAAAPNHSSSGSFSKRLAAVLVGAALCIGGAVLALHKTSLSTVSSTVSSAAASAASGASSSTAAESNSAATAATASSAVQAYRDSKMYEVLSSNTFYMESQCTSTASSAETSFQDSYLQISARYQGMTYSKVIISQQTFIFIDRDGFSYSIYPDRQLILKSDDSSADPDPAAIEQALTDGSLVLTTSTKTIDGITYQAESLSGNLSEALQSGSESYTGTETLCFDGDTLCYILLDTETDGEPLSTQMKITQFSYDVDTSLFELPDYKVYTYSASGGYYDESGNKVDPDDIFF